MYTNNYEAAKREVYDAVLEQNFEEKLEANPDLRKTFRDHASDAYGYTSYAEVYALAERFDMPCLAYLCIRKFEDELGKNSFFDKWKINAYYQSSAVVRPGHERRLTRACHAPPPSSAPDLGG